jgi:hypothetical protein
MYLPRPLEPAILAPTQNDAQFVLTYIDSRRHLLALSALQ